MLFVKIDTDELTAGAQSNNTHGVVVVEVAGAAKTRSAKMLPRKQAQRAATAPRGTAVMMMMMMMSRRKVVVVVSKATRSPQLQGKYGRAGCGRSDARIVASAMFISSCKVLQRAHSHTHHVQG